MSGAGAGAPEPLDSPIDGGSADLSEDELSAVSSSGAAAASDHASFSRTRIQLQRLAPATIRRHYTNALTRVSVLLFADLATYALIHYAILSMRETVVGGWLSSPLWAALPQFPGDGWHFGVALLIGLVISGTYGRGDARRSGQRILLGVFIAAGLTFWGSFWIAPLVPTVLSFVLALLIVSIVIYAERQLIDLAITRFSLGLGRKERVIFAGNMGEQAKRLEKDFLQGTRMISLGWISPTKGYGVQYDGIEADIWEILHAVDADTIVLFGEFPPKQFSEVVNAAAMSGCRILSPSRYGHLVGSRLSWHNGEPVMELTLPALKGQQLIVKRILDLVVSSIGLIFLSPLFLLIAVRIKLDSPGPVFFSQERVGFGGKVFRMHKFRTMTATADDEKQVVAHLNQTGDPRLFKITNDPRVTKFGAVLRAWSLDEIPQLWNVLRGDMSLVGPRPFFETDLAQYDDHHFDRLGAKPGITGLWQVTGRSSVVDFEEVVRLDSEYVSRWSLRLDLLILWRTFPAVLTRRGAY